MPIFGRESLKALSTCDGRLIDVASAAIRIADFKVLEGLSKLRWPNGKHNKEPALAFDFAPWYRDAPHIRWNDRDRFYYVAGIIIGIGHALGIPLRSGADWDMDSEVADESFHDLGHIELIL